MGIDHSAYFGLGIEVDNETFNDIDDKDEYLYDLLVNTKYFYFTTGNEYLDEKLKYFIVIDNINVFDKGYDIRAKVEKFETFLKNKKIKYQCKINIVGGLCVN